MSFIKTHVQSLKETVTAPVRKMDAAMLGLFATAMTVQPTLCEDPIKIRTNISMDTIVTGVIGIIIKIAFYVGVVYAAYGVFEIINAMRDDNGPALPQAIKRTAIGVALISLRLFLQLAGIIQ